MASIPPDSIPPDYPVQYPLPPTLRTAIQQLSHSILAGDTGETERINAHIAQKYKVNLLEGTAQVNRKKIVTFMKPTEMTISSLEQTMGKCLKFLEDSKNLSYKAIQPKRELPVPVTPSSPLKQFIQSIKELGYSFKILLNRLFRFSLSLTIKDKLHYLKQPPFAHEAICKSFNLDVTFYKGSDSQDFLKKLEAIRQSNKSPEEKKVDKLQLSSEVDRAIIEKLKEDANTVAEIYYLIVEKVGDHLTAAADTENIQRLAQEESYKYLDDAEKSHISTEAQAEISPLQDISEKNASLDPLLKGLLRAHQKLLDWGEQTSQPEHISQAALQLHTLVQSGANFVAQITKILSKAIKEL